MPIPTFSDRFCAAHQIPRERFDRVVFLKCLYPHARLVAPVWRFFHPNFFAADMDLVNSVGLLRRHRDLAADFEEFTHHPANRGVLRRFFRVRISSRRLRQLVKDTMPRGGRETQEPFGTDAAQVPH